MTTVDCAYANGAGAGDAPLTWAQQFMWDVITATEAGPAPFDHLIVHDLPEPVAVDTAVEFLRGFVLRHPVLRAGITVTADGTPVQHVRAAGILPVPLYHGRPPDAGLRAAIAGTTAAEMYRPLFVVAEGLVVTVAMRISHLAVDGWGVRLLTDDLDAADTVTPSPIALARFEGSAEGLAVEHRALAFARAVYTTCPATMWPRRRRGPDEPRFRYGQLRSARLLTAMESLTRDRRLGRAGVLAGALAAVAATSAGLPSALLFTISSNRFDAAWREYPGQLSQEAIMHVPIGRTIAETMRTATMETMRSLQAARYAPAGLRAVRRQIEWERGVRFDQLGSAIVLNLLTGEPAVVRDSWQARASSTFAWTGGTDRENLGLYLDAFQTATDFVLCVRVDTALMSPSEAEAWLRAVEWAIVATAAGDVTPAELRAPLAATGTAAPGDPADQGRRVLLAGGERLVAEVTKADTVHFQSPPDGGSDTGPVCYVFDPRRATTPGEMHRAVMAELPAAQPAVAPSSYIVVAERPTDPRDGAAWSRLPVLARGSGR